MRTGLVLEGGAMRGMYTAGVLDSFLDHGVQVDGILGVSAGACFGCNLFSGQRGRALRYNQRFMGDPRNVSLRSLITTGDIVNREFAYHTIPTQYDVFDEAAFGGAAFVEDDDACALQAHARAEHPRAQDAVEVDEGVAAELGGESVHAGHAHIVLAQADAADGEVGGGIDEERGEGAARDHDELGVGVRAAGVVEDGDDEGYVAERGEAHDGDFASLGGRGLRARCFVLIF